LRGKSSGKIEKSGITKHSISYVNAAARMCLFVGILFPEKNLFWQAGKNSSLPAFAGVQFFMKDNPHISILKYFPSV
jgi:hypothetical protein